MNTGETAYRQSATSGRSSEACPNTRVLMLVRSLPRLNVAGHLTYLHAFASFFDAIGCAFHIVVLHNRLPDDRFSFSVDGRFTNASYSFFCARRFYGKWVLRHWRWIAETAVRRLVRRLPHRLGQPLMRRCIALKSPAKPTSPFGAAINRTELRFALDEIARFRPTHLVIDSVFNTDVLPALAGATKPVSIVVTHDVLSRREDSFDALKPSKRHVRFGKRAELAALARADYVVAIQREEAAFFEHHLPARSKVICVPMPAGAQAIGRDGRTAVNRCLFVGSDAEHNVAGILWFFAEVWPRVRRVNPHATCVVCGTVCDRIPRPPPGVVLRGRVNDIAEHYREADAVVVPLVAGSGLKIKLVEALSFGKACVTTPIGAQGVDDGSGRAFICATSAGDFAAALAEVLSDGKLRRRLEAEAMQLAAETFEPGRAFAPLLAVLGNGSPPAPGLRHSLPNAHV